MRESLAIEVGRSFIVREVIDVLQCLFAVDSIPEPLHSDNGPEFAAHSVCHWLDQVGVETLFIAKQSPGENGHVESFTRKLRDELHTPELFLNLEKARWVIDC